MKQIILLILLMAGVLAQEAGVPYVDTRDAVIQSVTLSPDGETFYTYENNTLTHWSLNSVKVLNTAVINSEIALNQPLLKFQVLPSGSILVLATNEKLAIYDLQKNIFTQTLDINASLVDILPNGLLVIEKNGIMKKLNLKNLDRICVGELSEYYKKNNNNYDKLKFLLNGRDDDRFIIQLGNRYSEIDTKTLLPISETVSETYTPIDKLSPYSLIHRVSIEADWRQKGSFKNHILEKIWHTFSHQKNLLMLDDTGNNSYALYDTNTDRKLCTFVSFHDNNWLIITPDGYFDGSPDSRKYLYMKTPSGGSIPIDDATYQKYHRSISIKP